MVITALAAAEAFSIQHRGPSSHHQATAICSHRASWRGSSECTRDRGALENGQRAAVRPHDRRPSALPLVGRNGVARTRRRLGPLRRLGSFSNNERFSNNGRFSDTGGFSDTGRGVGRADCKSPEEGEA